MVEANVGYACEVGKVRKGNEDSVIIGSGCKDILSVRNVFVPNTPIRMWAVLDGMGGHRGGDEASQTAASALLRYYNPKSPDPSLSLYESAVGANKAVFLNNDGYSQEDRMGTTLTAFAIDNDDLGHLLNIGDSSAYWIRDGCIKQISIDHSLLTEETAAGNNLAQVLYENPGDGVLCYITSALGLHTHPHSGGPAINKVQRSRLPHEGRLQKGDKIVLCSDGLKDMMIKYFPFFMGGDYNPEGNKYVFPFIEPEEMSQKGVRARKIQQIYEHFKFIKPSDELAKLLSTFGMYFRDGVPRKPTPEDWAGAIELLSITDPTKLVSERKICDIVCDSGNPQEASDNLFKEAMRNGGEDNISIINIWLE